MPQCFIAILVAENVAIPFRQIQTRAQDIIRHERGHTAVTITHGSTPLHVTVFDPTFFEEGDYARYEHAWLSATRQFSPFEISFEQLGSFEPHTIYARVNSSSEQKLVALRQNLLQKLELEPMRPNYTPLVSLARKFPKEHFHGVRDAFVEALCAKQRTASPVAAFPLSFEATNLAFFRRAREENPWEQTGLMKFEGAKAA